LAHSYTRLEYTNPSESCQGCALSHRKEFLGGDVPRDGPREESDVKAFSTEYLVDAARIARRELVDQARIWSEVEGRDSDICVGIPSTYCAKVGRVKNDNSHNPFEPASLGLPVTFGPHMHQEGWERLCGDGTAVMVQDAAG